MDEDSYYNDDSYGLGDASASLDPGPCPACGGEDGAVLLGTLGRRTWVRCRRCGHDFNV